MKVGSIYVSIQGETTPLDKALDKAKQLATAGAGQIQSAYDKALTGLKNASANATASMTKGWNHLKSAWMEGVAAVAALAATWTLMQTAAKANQERKAFEAMAASYGVGSKQIITGLKEASGQAVDTMSLVRSAGTAMMMGINPEDTVKLMRIASATAKLTGQDISVAFEDISLAVGRSSKMILDNLGIIVDVGDANKVYATELGKASSALTDAEKKQAFMNATLKAGDDLMERLGGQVDTTSEKFQRFTATMIDMKVMAGDILIKVFYFLKGTFEAVAASALAVSGGIFKVIESVASLTDKLGLTKNAAFEWKIASEAAFGAAEELALKADQSFKDVASSNDAIIQGQVDYQAQLRETQKVLGDISKDQQKILDDHKKAAEEKAAAEEEMYEVAGFGAEAHYAKEAGDLVQKVANWQKAGADVYESEQWLYEQLGNLSEEAWQKGETAAGLAMDSMMAQSNTLVDEIAAATEAGINKIDELGLSIDTVDGSHIGITAALDGSGIVTEVDMLIEKFDQLRVSVTTPSGGGAVSTPADEGFTPDLGWQAQMEANSPSGDTINYNFNQNVSRADVNAITEEQKRQGAMK